MQDSIRRVGAAAFIAAAVCLGGGQAEAIQCAIFARSVTGLELSGDAWQWWNHASGTYSRGNAPRTGAVLVFMRSAPMRHGHVSVVTRIVNSREVLVDHANWGTRGAVARSVPVVDDSPNNDWSSVRVAFGGGYGRSNPTYGFIYETTPSSKEAVEAANHGSAVETAADDRDEVVESAPRRHGNHAWIRLAVGHGRPDRSHGVWARQAVRLTSSDISHSRERASHGTKARLVSASVPVHVTAHHEAGHRDAAAREVAAHHEAVAHADHAHAARATATSAKSAPVRRETKAAASAGASKSHRRA